MENYFDIHTHILPGVDDGAKDVNESGEMLQTAYEEGIRYIIATPHYAYGDQNPSVDLLKEKLSEVRKIAGQLGLDMEIWLGNELLHRPGTLDALASGEALTLADTKYILVEFLPTDEYETIYDAIHQYTMAGYLPIIAHVERYASLFKEYSKMTSLIEMGAYLQMNTESLAGGFFNRKAAYHRMLIAEGYIHFLGSDCHNMAGRKPQMKSAVSVLGNSFLATETARCILQKNPKKLFEGKYI